MLFGIALNRLGNSHEKEIQKWMFYEIWNVSNINALILIVGSLRMRFICDKDGMWLTVQKGKLVEREKKEQSNSIECAQN